MSVPLSDGSIDRAMSKRILITGGSGFIGSHVLIELVKKYPSYKFVNLDMLDYCSCPEAVDMAIGNYPNYKFIKGHITAFDLVNYVMAEEGIDTVLHFAAQTHVDNSFENSMTFTHTNVFGTHVLLEAARKHGVDLFVHVSTDEVYGEAEEDGEEMCEGHVLEPTNPYAATKAGAEFLVKAYHRSFNLPIIITRCNNVYGPRQFPEKLIPKSILRIMNGLPIVLHGDGTHSRRYIHVDDVVGAFDVIIHKGQPGHVYNIGTATELTNRDVAADLILAMKEELASMRGNDTGSLLKSLLKARVGESADLNALSTLQNLEVSITSKGAKDSPLFEKLEDLGLIQFVEDRPFNDLRYSIDCSKLASMGWSQNVPWKEGLKKTIKWYLFNAHVYDDARAALEPHPPMNRLSANVFGPSSPWSSY